MTSFNSNESFITYGTYKPKENMDELFERLQKPKELKLEPRLTCMYFCAFASFFDAYFQFFIELIIAY